jgi:glycosyltransferase involved in cell wall biosynthesis
MKNKVKISIAIPTYNGGILLKKSLEILYSSTKNKRFSNFFELVISDNGSTDNTQKIINKYTKKLKKNNIQVKYYRRNRNIGFYYNFIKTIKIATGEYILFMCDDDHPQGNFYEEIFKLFKNNDYKKLCFLPIQRHHFKNKLNLNIFGYVLTRGSSLSGVILKRNKISLKNMTPTLYPHNIIYLNYFLKYGMTNINLNSRIKQIEITKISNKFGNKGDRANRKNDFAVLDKIKIAEKFYNLKKINYLQLFVTIYKIYTWCFSIKWRFHKEKAYETEDLFFKEIQKYDRKFILKFSFLLIMFINLFSKKSGFYFNTLKKYLF